MGDTRKRPAQKAFRLSQGGQDLLAKLSERFGVSETAIVELAIRDKARAEGFPLHGDSGEGDTQRGSHAELSAQP